MPPKNYLEYLDIDKMKGKDRESGFTKFNGPQPIVQSVGLGSKNKREKNKKNAKNWHTRCARRTRRTWGWLSKKIPIDKPNEETEETLKKLWGNSEKTLRKLWGNSEETLKKLWRNS